MKTKVLRWTKGLLVSFITLHGLSVQAQTVLINPAGDGGFATPGGFAANNWMVANAPTGNMWYVGTAVPAFPTDAAYISNDGGVTNAYTNSAASVSHFYRDVTFPAGQTNMNLSFNWQANGETGFWDALMIYIAPTTYTPTGTNVSLGTGYLAAPAIHVASFWLQTTPQTANIALSPTLIGNCSAPATWRLIFSWKNDGSLGTNPPASIDNISLTCATPIINPAQNAGPFTINNLLPTGGTNFASFTDAINWLNTATACGITNNLVFNVSAGQTFTELPPAITATGTSTNSITFQRSGSGANPAIIGTNGIGTLDAGIRISGGDYITFNGIDIRDNAANVNTTTQLEYGYIVVNSSATNGAQNNTITNCKVTLNRTNTATRGIFVTASTTGGGFTPTAATGSNSNTVITNDTVTNSYAGIHVLGNGTFPDGGLMVNGNVIGSTTPSDIGGAVVSQTWGIRIANGNGVTMQNNLVRNVTANTTVDGIFLETCQGVNNISFNKVMAVRNGSTTSTASASGIKASLSATGTNESRIFNNFVSDITCGYTGTATATRIVRGINVLTGGATTSSHNVFFNSVSIDATSSPNASSTAFEIGTTTGPVMNVRNNIFANYTGAQAGLAGHYSWVSTSATLTGNTGSVSNNNDLYIANTTNGYVGRGNTVTYATLNDWQVAMTQDAASVNADPQFINTLNDLHTFSVNVNGLADMTGITYITTDIDAQVRVAPHDIGADNFTPPTLDLGATVLVSPLTTGCHTSNENLIVRIQNFAAGAHDFTIDNCTVTVNITGAITQTLNFTINNNSLNAGNPLPSGGTINVPVGTFNMTTPGTYTFNAYTVTTGDIVTVNDAIATVNIVNSGGTFTASNGGELCLGSSMIVSTVGSTNGGTVQWESSPDGITWTPVVGAVTATDTVTPNDTLLYRAVVCGYLYSTVDTLFPELVVPATTVNDTICGNGTVTLSASGSGTLNWYTSSTGGTMVNSGATYSVALAATDTFYVENTSGTPPTFHQTTYAAGNGSSGNVFTIKALNTITITGFDGHLSTVAGTPSTWEVWYRPNDYLLTPGSHLSNAGWTQLGTGSVNSAGPGNPTPVPVSMNLIIPAGSTYSFQVFTTTGSVSYTNGTVLGALFNANTDLEVYQGHGGTAFAGMVNSPRVFNGRVHYSAGCGSVRTPVIGVVTPAPVVNATSSNSVCGSGSSTLVASSSNTNYVYTWTPPATLNTATGDTVIASPSTTTTYIVTGVDVASGCTDSASVVVIHAMNPVGTATVSNDTVCVGTQVTLGVTVGNPNVIVGTNQAQNTTTTYPAPYGNWYWGSRHQFLITAADLTAAGLAAGPIDALSFYVTTLTATALNNFTIQMGHTNTASLTAFLAVPMTTVYSNVSYTPVLGINQHVFSTMFVWDGVSNIVVETCHNNSAFTNNCVFQLTNTSYNSSAYLFQDAAGVCSNNSISATATQRPRMVFRRAFPYNYTWTPSSSLNNANIQSPTATIPGSISYMVTITDSTSGCSIVDTVDVHALPTPAPDFGADTVICSNSPLTLDGTAGPYTYLWQDNSTAQTYSAGTFGTYNVMVTDTTNGCTGADTILIGVNIAPTFTLGSDVTICSGNQTTFTGPSGSYSYLWNTGDTIDNIVTGTAGAYNLTVTDTTTLCFSIDTVVLYVNPVPAVALGADTSACSGNGSLILSGPAGNFTYMWNTSDTTQSISVNTTGVYSVLVVDTATACSATDTIQVIYNMSPMVALGNDTTFCSNNGPITLVAPAGPYNYMWSDMSTGSTLNAGTTGNYYIDVTDSLSGCVSTDSIMITVPMSPAVMLNDTAFCGTSVVLNGPSGSYMYMWNTADTTQSITVNTTGSYVLTVTDSASGCIGVDSAQVNVNANPTVTASASTMTPCADDANVILTGTPAGGIFSGTSVTGNQFDPSIGAGTYSIVYNFTDVNGCSGADTLSITVSACVGINDPFAGAGMNVFPNPNSGMFTFTAADVNAAEMTIEIVTIEGQVIKSDKFSNVQGNFSEEINMNEFANGVYFMRVTTDGAVFTQRIVKQD